MLRLRVLYQRPHVTRGSIKNIRKIEFFRIFVLLQVAIKGKTARRIPPFLSKCYQRAPEKLAVSYVAIL
jgi:hypothetical protein